MPAPSRLYPWEIPPEQSYEEWRGYNMIGTYPTEQVKRLKEELYFAKKYIESLETTIKMLDKSEKEPINSVRGTVEGDWTNAANWLFGDI